MPEYNGEIEAGSGWFENASRMTRYPRPAKAAKAADKVS
jgi:hypothetical protein